MRSLLTSICVIWLLPLALTATASERIDYPALFKAIAKVESDLGDTSHNRYQITYAYIYDLERITGERWDYKTVTKSNRLSERAMRTYWAYYTSRYINRTGKPVSASILAKLHRVGYAGLTKKKTTADAYWRRVQKWYIQYRSTSR